MRNLVYHSLFWLVFLFMWNRLLYFYVDNPVNSFYFSMIDVSLVMVAFYTAYLGIMPDFFGRKNVYRLLIFCFLLVAALSGAYAILAVALLRVQAVPISFNIRWDYTDLQYNRIFVALLGILAGCFVKLAMDRLQVRRQMAQVEKERAQAELALLRSQLDPHFLFNALNSLHTQLDVDTQQARNTLVSIADMLRYQLYQCTTDFIALGTELEYITNYFRLQSIRKDQCTTRLDIGDHPPGLMIAPLLLLPFIENAFKYVSDHEHRENSIGVSLRVTDQVLFFECINTHAGIFSGSGSNEGGIGLANVKKRLELLYPSKATLEIRHDKEYYTVQLKLEL